MHALTTFMKIAYSTAFHADGTAHYYNDTEFFKEYYSLVLGKNSDVVNLGFNIGMQAEIILPLTSGRIFGFEASRKIFEFSQEKFKDEKRVKLFNNAISNTTGPARFLDTDLWGAGSLEYTAGMTHCQVGENFSETTVNACTLDDALRDESNIGLIKLDIEGAELLALEGAARTIARNRPFMVMEYCHNALSFDFRGEKIRSTTLFDYAREIGYKVYNIYGICLDNIEVWNTSILKDTADVYLIPDERHEQWSTALLPAYQYRIYGKMLDLMEWLHPGSEHPGLISLPQKIYGVINTSSRKESLAYLSTARERIRSASIDRAAIFNYSQLSHRAKILLILIHDGKIEEAYELGAIIDITPDLLAPFEKIAHER
ncbi:FkbM family methyltransferase [Thauera sp.]|uniref:FkbM family methyltransferase n=1 Tax=Thauera sp. TaxID=1905334 RepID=UPI0039E5E070